MPIHRGKEWWYIDKFSYKKASGNQEITHLKLISTKAKKNHHNFSQTVQSHSHIYADSEEKKILHNRPT